MFGFKLPWDKIIVAIGIALLIAGIIWGIVTIYKKIQSSDNEGVVAVVEQKHSVAQEEAVNKNITIRKKQDEVKNRRTNIDYAIERVQSRTY